MKFTYYIYQIFIGCLWWVLIMAVVLFVPFLRVWWWIIFPLLLATELRNLYMWWVNWDYSYASKKWVMLEIIPPKEILVPVKAMEDVFNVMWGPLYDDPSWRENWMEGILDDAPGWMSWEIASIEGVVHFYMRVLEENRETLETALYSHYPELEIVETSDYTKNVPQNLPNAEWNTYGEDFKFVKPNPYPIKTYEHFFEPEGHKIQAEEKRIDSITSLLELMSKIGPGEQFWLQFITMSVADKDNPNFKKELEEVMAKLSKRPLKAKENIFQILGDLIWNLLMGPHKDGDSYEWLSSAKDEEPKKEPSLTAAEKDMIAEVENKASKPLFRTVTRGVYVAKRANFNVGHKLLTRAYFSHFNTINFNVLKQAKETRPKTQYLFRKSVPILRARKLFRNYVLRFPPLFPNRKNIVALMNAEELATLYHFPLRITGLVAPTMGRVESKKGGPPPNLPVE